MASIKIVVLRIRRWERNKENSLSEAGLSSGVRYQAVGLSVIHTNHMTDTASHISTQIGNSENRYSSHALTYYYSPYAYIYMIQAVDEECVHCTDTPLKWNKLFCQLTL